MYARAVLVGLNFLYRKINDVKGVAHRNNSNYLSSDSALRAARGSVTTCLTVSEFPFGLIFNVKNRQVIDFTRKSALENCLGTKLLFFRWVAIRRRRAPHVGRQDDASRA
jgi:hypothetical protein